jgi:hypothetical protein
LVEKVNRVRRNTLAQRKTDPRQPDLQAAVPAAEIPTAERTKPDSAPMQPAAMAPGPRAPESLTDESPVSVTYRFTPIQLARYEAITEKLHKTRSLPAGVNKEDLLLSAMEALLDLVTGECGSGSSREAAGGDQTKCEVTEGGVSARHTRAAGEPGFLPRGKKVPRGIGQAAEESGLLPRGKNLPHYKVIIYKCDTCGRSIVPTSRGEKAVGKNTIDSIECDAVIERPGRRNTATIPPSLRRRVLARDRHRCRAPGCRNRHFLEVHHRTARAEGGSNKIENLITLCSSCHRVLHERGLP